MDRAPNVTHAAHANAFVLALFVTCAVGAMACKKDGAPQASLATPSAASGVTSSASGAAAASDAGPGIAAAIDLWAAAASLEPEELSRLALTEGSAGLVAGATDDTRRKVAVMALAYGEDLDALPFLADVASAKDPSLALAAADVAATLAARKRAALAPEDALEVREGCDKLGALAKDTARPKPLRAKAIRVLRLLADRGCARDVPAL